MNEVKNKLYTQSYAIKRLTEAGFRIKKLPIRYESSDARYWSVLVNFPDREPNLILTCLKNGIAEKKGKFVVMSTKSNQIRIETMSAEVLVDLLTDLADPEPVAT